MRAELDSILYQRKDENILNGTGTSLESSHEATSMWNVRSSSILVDSSSKSFNQHGTFSAGGWNTTSYDYKVHVDF